MLPPEVLTDLHSRCRYRIIRRPRDGRFASCRWGEGTSRPQWGGRLILPPGSRGGGFTDFTYFILPLLASDYCPGSHVPIIASTHSLLLQMKTPRLTAVPSSHLELLESQFLSPVMTSPPCVTSSSATIRTLKACSRATSVVRARTARAQTAQAPPPAARAGQPAAGQLQADGPRPERAAAGRRPQLLA